MSYTEQMENRLFQQWDEFDDSENYRAQIEFLNKEGFFRTFGEGLLSFLQVRKPELTSESSIKFIEVCCEETGVSVRDIASTNTLKSWFKGGPRPKKGEDSRASMFALAFALRLTADETADLFHKVYLDRAFDYRSAREIVYYFCLQHKKSWSDVGRLIERVSALDGTSSDRTVYTSQLKTDIQALIDEDKLIAYIRNHGHNLTKRSVSAKKTVERLIEKARQTVAAETKLFSDFELEYFRNTDPTSLNHVYEVITNHTVRGDKGTKTLFKNARLPKEIKSRFPEAGTLSKKEPTYEELRKLVILLSSYNYWFEMQNQGIDVDIDNYIEDTNAYLDECGFSLMYYGNPYDWMFLYCALSERPLDVFRGLLAEALDSEDD